MTLKAQGDTGTEKMQDSFSRDERDNALSSAGTRAPAQVEGGLVMLTLLT